MSEEDLRDCFAMFALMRMSFNDAEIAYRNGAEKCYKIADAMLEARKPKEKSDEEDSGIASVAKRTYKRKS
jgi:hypothetical protein